MLTRQTLRLIGAAGLVLTACQEYESPPPADVCEESGIYDETGSNGVVYTCVVP